MPLVDTHVHLNFEVFAADLDRLAQAWREVEVVRLIHACVVPEEFSAMQAIADRFPELSLAVGLHPLDVDRWTEATAAQIRDLAATDGRVVAIGETGLDFYKAENGDRQRQAFWAQMAIAHDLGLPVIVHCRDAARETADLIANFQRQIGPIRGVMHCWAGTPEETSWFLDLGFYISFSGIVTFKNAGQVKDSAQLVPEQRLLIETDCPFLSPEPQRKHRPNQPAFLAHVATHLAELRQVSLDQLAAITTQNAWDLFRLPGPVPTTKPLLP
ncbi:MAG: TatD family hydrolase [Cyanobacteriota bacterium]|jgi:TatD DNase family protein|nr:TatD family hydrolase [Cyanobacteriota bacterium]